MYEYVQLIPDNFLQEEYAHEIDNHYLKGFFKTFKSRKKEAKNDFDEQEEGASKERVWVAQNGTGIFVMNKCISKFFGTTTLHY